MIQDFPARGRKAAAAFALGVLLPACFSAAAFCSDDQAANRDLSLFLLPLRKSPEPPPGQAALGKQLFFDKRLSADGTMSCATCHDPSRAWSDGRARAVGAGGRELERNTPSLFNVEYSAHFFWDGRESSLDELAWVPLLNPLEMNQDPARLVAKLKAIPGYAREFEEAYGPQGLSSATVSRAIAAFIRADIHVGETRADRYYRDPAALSLAERRGFGVFMGKGGCIACHHGPGFTDDFFHNIGLKALPGEEDSGRYGVVPRAPFWRAFKTPSLKNAALTAPYMHDGSLKTLAEVVEFYDRGGDDRQRADPLIRPLNLTRGEKRDLAAFLQALAAPAAPFTPPVLPPEAAPGPLGAAPAAADATAAPYRAPAAEKPPEAPAARFSSGKTQALPACPEPFSVDRLLGLIAARPAEAFGPRFRSEDFSDAALRYYEYRSFAEKNPAACSPLRSLAPWYKASAQTPETECLLWYYDTAAASALLTGDPDFAKICGGAFSFDYPEMTAADGQTVCGVIRENIGQPEKLCGLLAPLYLRPEMRDTCAFRISQLSPSRPAALPSPLPAEEKERYEAYAAFAQARRTGDPASCGSSELCAVLLGQAAPLAERRALQIRRDICEISAGPAAP